MIKSKIFRFWRDTAAGHKNFYKIRIIPIDKYKSLWYNPLVNKKRS